MNKVQIVLSCGHSLRVPVKDLDPFEPVECKFDGWQSPYMIHTQEWRVVCAHCQFGRWVGQDKAHADRKAKEHARRHLGHETDAVYDTVTADGRGELYESVSRKHLRLVSDDGSLFTTDSQSDQAS